MSKRKHNRKKKTTVEEMALPLDEVIANADPGDRRFRERVKSGEVPHDVALKVIRHWSERQPYEHARHARLRRFVDRRHATLPATDIADMI